MTLRGRITGYLGLFPAGTWFTAAEIARGLRTGTPPVRAELEAMKAAGLADSQIVRVDRVRWRLRLAAAAGMPGGRGAARGAVADILWQMGDDVSLVVARWGAVLDLEETAALGEVIFRLGRIGRQLQGLPEPAPGGDVPLRRGDALAENAPEPLDRT
jgi:hypothetical protein